MSEFLNAVRLAADGSLDGVSDAVILAMGVVGALLLVIHICPFRVHLFGHPLHPVQSEAKQLRHDRRAGG